MINTLTGTVHFYFSQSPLIQKLRGIIGLVLWLSKCDFRASTLASPGNLLEMHIFEPYPRSAKATEVKTEVWGFFKNYCSFIYLIE